MSSTLERQARTVGGNSKLLRYRLNSAKTVLHDEIRAYFKPGRYDFVTKRLVSESGQYALVWSVRDQPKSPISYENQQTNLGSVKLIRL